ncbi:hypothetical protein AC731_012550 [Thauera humireducens]|uniref:Uncharacterized protein n=1 Tax=Thauera humireducens TaxID=1134435 RepID=A0A127K6Z0_9RHOO|nr:hypothetical protein AC731_012550 [Thauera humireducens]
MVSGGRGALGVTGATVGVPAVGAWQLGQAGQGWCCGHLLPASTSGAREGVAQAESRASRASSAGRARRVGASVMEGIG